METAALIDQLAADGTLIVAGAARAGWDAPVPYLDWTVRDVVTHVGGVHRWAADIVRTARTSDDGPGFDNAPRVPDDELAGWFLAGHAALVSALGEAPADLDAFTFLRGRTPLEFWARRQAHETAIHRYDVEAAGGDVTAFPVDFAQDGIDEIACGFGSRRTKTIARDGVLALVPVDGGATWTLTFGGERTVAEPATPLRADATVRGTSSDLYLWLWNRPSGVQVDGDAALAAAWGAAVRIR